VADHGDGTYEASFVLPREAVGDQKLCVSVQGSPIRGSPFLLKAAGLFKKELFWSLVCFFTSLM